VVKTNWIANTAKRNTRAKRKKLPPPDRNNSIERSIERRSAGLNQRPGRFSAAQSWRQVSLSTCQNTAVLCSQSSPI